MTHLQDVRALIKKLEGDCRRLHSDIDVLEKAWSPDVKHGIPEMKARLDGILTELRTAEAEEHRLTFHRLKKP
jgi:hypothetical protein